MSRKNILVLCVIVLGSGVTGCATVARQMAEEGTEGALEAIREEEQQRSVEAQAKVEELARRNAEQLARGMMDAVTRPEGAGAGPSSGTGGSGLGGEARSLSSSVASEMARGLSAELERQLGPDGSGPLARSLSATAGQMAASMVQQSRGELGSLFPECGGLQGEQARTRRDAQLARWGESFSKGVAGGLVQAFQPWLLLLTFAGGLLVGLLVFLSLSVARANREAGGRTFFSRQQRHA